MLFRSHTIKKGETIYSLSKTYEVSIEQIEKDNPEIADGLKEGNSLKILATLPPATTKKEKKEKEPKEPPKPIIEVKETKKDNTIYHVVKAKETLWSIAQTYGSTPNELRTLNPDAFKNNELMIGALLQIPPQSVNEISVKTIDTIVAVNTAETSETPQYHLVKQGETLYSLAQQYATTVDEIRALNPDAFKNNELMNGVLLLLPTKVKQTEIIAIADTNLTTTPVYFDLPIYSELEEPRLFTRPIRASLILPLIAPREIIDYTSENLPQETMAATRTRNTDNFFAFYQGALLAIEELKTQGLSLQLSVFDSYDKKNINELVFRDRLENQDIIFGPVYASNIQPVAEYANNHQIKIVSPLDPNAEILANENPHFFQISPPTYYRQKKLIDNILAVENANIVMVYDANGGDSIMIESYKNLLGEKFKDVQLLSHYVRKGFSIRENLTKVMNPDKMNCILVASNNEAIVSDVAANLYLLTFGKLFSITLYGTERWRSFETIDLTYFHTLNLHLVVPFFIDHKNETVNNFVERFQETYKADPSQYAFQGYDIFYYFLQAMMQYGNDFQKYLPQYNPALLQTNYQFKQVGNRNSGLVNSESCLIIYKPNFTIVKE